MIFGLVRPSLIKTQLNKPDGQVGGNHHTVRNNSAFFIYRFFHIIIYVCMSKDSLFKQQVFWWVHEQAPI